MACLRRRFMSYFRDNVDHVNNGGHILAPFLGIHVILGCMIGGMWWLTYTLARSSPNPSDFVGIISVFIWIFRIIGICGVILFHLIIGLVSLVVTLDTAKGLVAFFVFKDKRYYLF